MTFSNPFGVAVSLLAVILVAGCAGFTPPPPFPTEPIAKKHYNAGDQYLKAQDYQSAAVEFQKSLQHEHGAYITPSKLAVAYYGEQRFVEAAEQFAASYKLWGGPGNGPIWALMQAATLQRAGDRASADKLLHEWLESGVKCDATGCYISGEPLSGYWRLVAQYLLGTAGENSVLSKASPDNKGATYLLFGIANAAKGNKDKAKEFLQLAAPTLTPGGWAIALMKAEMQNLEQ